MENVKKHLDLLGKPVVDKVTGFTGIVATVGFDLYGCIQAIVTPVVNDSGELKESKWFDIQRLNVTCEKPVMERPHFDFSDDEIAKGNKGPSEKPCMADSKW